DQYFWRAKAAPAIRGISWRVLRPNARLVVRNANRVPIDRLGGGIKSHHSALKEVFRVQPTSRHGDELSPNPIAKGLAKTAGSGDDDFCINPGFHQRVELLLGLFPTVVSLPFWVDPL